MNEPTGQPDLPEGIERETSRWLLRCDRGLTPAEQDDFLHWLVADPRHAECLAAQRRDWERLNLLADWRPEQSARPNRDLLAAPVRRPRWWLPITLGAAAAIATLLFVASQSKRASGPPAPHEVAMIRHLQFEDGSTAELNRGAEIEPAYSASERRVRLRRGEAYFNVAKDAARPFIVDAHGIETRAVGTAFDVRLDAQVVEVLVKEGTVSVVARSSSAPGLRELRPAMISANERLVVPRTESPSPIQVRRVAPAEIERRLAWQPRMLDFNAALLGEIVAEFNRRNEPVKLVIESPALAQLQLSAILRSDNVEGLVRFLEAGFAVRAERKGDTIMLHDTAGR